MRDRIEKAINGFERDIERMGVKVSGQQETIKMLVDAKAQAVAALQVALDELNQTASERNVLIGKVMALKEINETDEI